MNLTVPYKKQMFENSCFCAGVYMILKYYGKEISEEVLYEQAKLPGNNATWDATIASIIAKEDFKMISYWDGKLNDDDFPQETAVAYKEAFDKAVKEGSFEKKKNASLQTIYEYLDKEIPVLAEVSARELYNSSEEVTHIIVITGYSENILYYHDPYEGPSKEISVDDFKKCWKKLPYGYNHSMSIILPNSKLRKE